ncbi:type I-F CRISPR-associated protein Csy1 [Moraxella sp. Tifton1]|uniref:type I-F CRISPR-associated protein Csy1 n=1 Tax=Moraxella oculi TaxID=2940516 RepID=UPI002011B775|nr:type I-F CRISPR-associated protein Csy1 [Moraxella sp. Tifton1]MCL1622995.1 type I-F CRISPR-associated protein Csy1 [Moraxella sp. Tifton1]
MTTAFTTSQINEAIERFLDAQYNKKTEKEQKQLIQATEQQDAAKIHQLNTALKEAKHKYQKKNWLAEAKIMAENIQVGTHISKGVHSSSRGDNVNFVQEVCHEYVNTKTINSGFLDANSKRGAIDLPLIAFFEWEVIEGSGIKMREVILQNTEAVAHSFDNDITLSKQYQETFLACLNNQLTNPQTHATNKQILWPLSQQDAGEDDYINLVPLHPTVLAYEVGNIINQHLYSDDNKSARQNRGKKTTEQKPYLTIKDLVAIQLGGTQPQNISQLVSKQKGRNYLLPSMPPIFKRSPTIRIPPNATSIFDTKAVLYHTKDNMAALFDIIKVTHNNVNIRDARKAIASSIARQLIRMGQSIQQIHTAGWSREYHALSMSQKYWLDPKRADLDGEEEFKNEYETKDWQDDITTDFANWLQALLKAEFTDIAHEFSDSEHDEWRRMMADELKQAARLNKGELL